MLIKVGVSALALMLATLPVAACVLPGAGMDVCRAGVLQENGGTMRGHGDGKIPSLLSADRLANRFTCPEGVFFSGPFESRGSSGTTDLGPSRHMPFADTDGVSISYTHSPPGLESQTTTILRI